MEPKEALEEGKAAFHWALAGVFVPGLGLLAAPILATSFAGRGAWGRRLAILGVADLLVLAAFLVLARRADEWPVPVPEGPRVGVLLEEGGTTVKTVVEGWPAAEAGLRPGDVLKSIDGAAVKTQDDLVRRLREGEQILTVERAGTSIEFRVTPRRPQVREGGLFEKTGQPRAFSVDRSELFGYGVVGAAVLAAWLASRRHPGPRVWRGFLPAIALFIGGSLGAAYLLGTSRGGLLISLMLGHAALALGGILASRWLRADRPPEPPPALGPLRALLVTLFYTLAVYPRAGILLLAADLIFFGGAGKPADVLETFATTLHGPLGVILFALAVAVVGPIAEELVFRGFLLPRLAARIGRGWALAASSVIFGCMHANYGLYAGLTVVLGWMLGWARLSSGGLTVPIALHMIINGAVTAMFFLRGA
jgi:uncharacterized protein